MHWALRWGRRSRPTACLLLLWTPSVSTCTFVMHPLGKLRGRQLRTGPTPAESLPQEALQRAAPGSLFERLPRHAGPRHTLPGRVVRASRVRPRPRRPPCACWTTASCPTRSTTRR